MILNYYKNKFYINIAVILLFFAAITFFIIYPALVEISRVNKEIMNERIKLEKKLALGLNIKKIIQDLEAIEEPAKDLDDIFWEKNNELNFIGNLEAIAAKYDVSLSINSDFSGVDLGSGLNQVEVLITATGHYKPILKFLSELEKQRHYLNFKSLLLAKTKTGADPTLLSVQLTGQTYFKK